MTAGTAQVSVIGLGLGPDWTPPRNLRALHEAEVLAGGPRLLDFFPEHSGERLPLAGPLNLWLEAVAQRAAQGRRVAVLASGDPNFFGVAARVIKRCGADMVTVYPGLTTIQAAFAKIGRTWAGAEVVSLHGREQWFALWSAMVRAQRQGAGQVAVYTDLRNTPAEIARRLSGRGQKHWRLCVFEALGGPDEKWGDYALEEAAQKRFNPLNLAVLLMTGPPAALTLGAPDHHYHHRAGLITKAEIRAAALGGLALEPHHIFWDLGAGSGSVSLEASLLLTRGQVWAVERAPERVADIELNRAKFGAAQVEIRLGQALETLAELPDPDRVFIGGAGRELPRIIQAAAQRLKPGGRLLANVVTLENMAAARSAMVAAGMNPGLLLLQIGREAPLAGGVYLKPLNPVWLISGVKND